MDLPLLLIVHMAERSLPWLLMLGMVRRRRRLRWLRLRLRLLLLRLWLWLRRWLFVETSFDRPVVWERGRGGGGREERERERDETDIIGSVQSKKAARKNKRVTTRSEGLKEGSALPLPSRREGTRTHQLHAAWHRSSCRRLLRALPAAFDTTSKKSRQLYCFLSSHILCDHGLE